MSAEELIIAIARIAGSLLVLRWALVGGVVAVLVDLSDLFMKNLLELGGVSNYQAFDKWLDQVYLLAFLVVALRWKGPARTVAILLYAWRMAGFFAFEATGDREILLLFPNVFEFWFLFVAAVAHLKPQFAFTNRNIGITLGVLTALKEFQEFALHQARWLDSFTAVEAVEAVADWLSGPFW
ncbi:MAG TPA: hypothetical protein QGF35_03175 [Dehalococcoidia bacterium]|nr:hypothetical protein [Dehalococcoidia bacterium]